MTHDVLLDNVSGANTGASFTQYGGPHCIHVHADTWSGGSVTLQSSADGGATWQGMQHFADDDEAVFTEDGANVIASCGQGHVIRAVSAGVALAGCTVLMSRAASA